MIREMMSRNVKSAEVVVKVQKKLKSSLRSSKRPLSVRLMLPHSVLVFFMSTQFVKANSVL